MNVNITFRHLEHTPALDETIRNKSEKFTMLIKTILLKVLKATCTKPSIL